MLTSFRLMVASKCIIIYGPVRGLIIHVQINMLCINNLQLQVYNALIFHATNWQNLCHNYIQKFTSCMFHNKLLLVCPLHEHSTCHRLGCPAAVGFRTDLQLSCRMHKGMEVYVFHVPHNLLSKITTVMI